MGYVKNRKGVTPVLTKTAAGQVGLVCDDVKVGVIPGSMRSFLNEYGRLSSATIGWSKKQIASNVTQRQGNTIYNADK